MSPQVARSPQGREAAAQRGEAERSVGPREGGKPSEDQQVCATLLEVRTVTGFLHQVRATLAHLGHPLAGDRTYAPDGDQTSAARHMLHAAALGFAEIRAESPDPRDFAELLAALR